MSRIVSVFKDKRKKVLVGYITVGYPNIAVTLDTVRIMASEGCDIIELGIPFSDPLADGVTIQNASYHALLNGITPAMCLDIVRKLRQTINIPLLFMTYYNLVHNYGLENFCRDCSEVGLDGLIIPDLPPEEGLDLELFTNIYNIDLVYLLAPTSTEERVRIVASKSRGFIYLVSVTGVTGVRNFSPDNLNDVIARIKFATDTPICIGFGISTATQAARLSNVANGIIVGSRFIQLMETGDIKSLSELIKELRDALDKS